MTFTLIVVAFALIGLLFLIAAGRNIRRRRIAGAVWSGVASLTLFLIAACALLVAASLRSYQRLSAEQAAGELQFTRLGYHEFNGAFTYPSGERADFALRGDEWQVDAHILKWSALANWVGFDAAYRLDRISGRYTKIEDERSLPRTVYPLNPPDRFDIWELVRSNAAWLPWIDAVYGSATFLPMADGAVYDVEVTESGLLARPVNDAARTAVGNWH
jgi:hypothetical protein